MLLLRIIINALIYTVIIDTCDNKFGCQEINIFFYPFLIVPVKPLVNFALF